MTRPAACCSHLHLPGCSSVISNDSPRARELPREADMIRVSHLVGQEPAFAGATSECSDEDSIHRWDQI